MNTAKRILIIDDEEDIRELHADLISKEFQVEIIEASSVENGIRVLCDNKNIDAIISDANTPAIVPPIIRASQNNLSGQDLLKFVSTLERKLPILFVSGGKLTWAKGYSLVDCLSKPIERKLLLATFNNLMQKL